LVTAARRIGGPRRRCVDVLPHDVTDKRRGE
jgi:hypothetical protein